MEAKYSNLVLKKVDPIVEARCLGDIGTKASEQGPQSSGTLGLLLHPAHLAVMPPLSFFLTSYVSM